MTVNIGIPGSILPAPTEVYDYTYMVQLVRALERQFVLMNNPGVKTGSVLLLSGLNLPPNIESPLNVKNLPTSSAGLNTGDVWNDGGTLKVV